MAKLPLINAIQLIKILGKIGFKTMRQEGSHIFLRHEDGRTTVIPSHPGEKIVRGLLNQKVSCVLPHPEGCGLFETFGCPRC